MHAPAPRRRVAAQAALVPLRKLTPSQRVAVSVFYGAGGTPDTTLIFGLRGGEGGAPLFGNLVRMYVVKTKTGSKPVQKMQNAKIA